MFRIGASRCTRVLVFIALLHQGLWSASTEALPPSFADEALPTNWNLAVGLTFAPDGRMFVWEKAGLVWLVENGIRASTPIIDLSDEVGNWRDHGLLGFALDPAFDENGYIYLLYVVDYHHLIYAGTPDYDPGANVYYQDTIGRLTRYQCTREEGVLRAEPASRTILIGESIGTGIPLLHQSHGCGSLLFGEDGTLLVSCGDGGSYLVADTGGPMQGSSNTGLADGIISAKEDVGAFRSQLIDSLSGKVLRIDPATGDGVPGNPWFDPESPRSARSRTWALGLRNPFRMSLRPGTGAADPSANDPGTLYIGDVGWSTWEELNTCNGSGQNFGWPIFEGMDIQWDYFLNSPMNLDAPNPLAGTTPPDQPLCTQTNFLFSQLVQQDTLDPNPWFANPCDPAEPIPADLPVFIHRRPALDWKHGNGPARVPIYAGQVAETAIVGAPESPVAGPQFGGNSSTGGVWYTGQSFPEDYWNTYFLADYARGWIMNLVFDENDTLLEVRPFAPADTAPVVAMAVHPIDGHLYYISYNETGIARIRRIYHVDQLPPVAAAEVTPAYGPAPLLVQFSSANSSDPENQPLSFEWDLGDGSPIRRDPNPVHVYGADDVSRQGEFIAAIFELDPPHPTGGGNPDPEVMRDADMPAPNTEAPLRQFDTYHGGDQQSDDWIGYVFPEELQFTALIFQEGMHFSNGGWFQQLAVEVRHAGEWAPVSGLAVQPPYAGANAVHFETYVLTFEPVSGDAIRLRGEPGGSAAFISMAELRVLALPEQPLPPQSYAINLKVTDYFNEIDTTKLFVSVNNTPPQVEITSPEEGYLLPASESVMLPLEATIVDAEQSQAELTCEWQVILHHNNHTHPEPIDPQCATEALFTPHGSIGDLFFYEVKLVVTDAAGLYAEDSVNIFGECQSHALDLNGDCLLSPDDAALLRACFGPVTDEACASADLDEDEDVDCDDWTLYQTAFYQVTNRNLLLPPAEFAALLIAGDEQAVDVCMVDINGDGSLNGMDVEAYCADFLE